MPGTAYSRSTAVTKRRRPSRKVTKRSSTVPVPTMVSIGRQPFPKVLRNTVRYCDSFSIASVKPNVAPNYFAFVCNGLYDPNNTTAGHQPMYFDQLMAIYDHYCVIGSTITVSLQNAPIGGYTTMTGIFIDDDNAPAIASRNNCVERSIGGRGCTMKTTYGGDVKYCSLKWSANKAFNVENVCTREDLKGSASVNPTENQCFIVWNNVSNDAPTGETVYYDVTIDFDVIWTELATVTES